MRYNTSMPIDIHIDVEDLLSKYINDIYGPDISMNLSRKNNIERLLKMIYTIARNKGIEVKYEVRA